MERVDLKQLEEDVYIIRINRSLFKIDKQLLRHIPKLATPLETGQLLPGRPYDLGVRCQPRAVRDVLSLLKKQLSNQDPFHNFQSVQVDIDNEVLRLVQQLQAADALQLESIGDIIADEIRKLCPDEDGFHAVLKDTGFERHLFAPRSFGRVSRTNFTTKDEQALMKQVFVKMGLFLSRPGLTRRAPQQRLQEFMTSRAIAKKVIESSSRSHPSTTTSNDQISGCKRKIEPVIDDHKSRERAFKKPKPATECDLDEDRLHLDSSPPLPEAQSPECSAQAPDFYKMIATAPLSEQDVLNSDDEERPELDEHNDEVDKDDFEQDSFQIDEDEVASDDIDELVMSDPVKFDCIASPQRTSQEKTVSTPATATKKITTSPITPSPLSQCTLFAGSGGLPKLLKGTMEKASTHQIPPILPPQSTKARTVFDNEASKSKDPVPSASSSLDHPRFDLKQFLCTGLTISEFDCYILVCPDALEIR